VRARNAVLHEDSAGDMNADGHDDVLVLAHGNDEGA
jgi:hypothetical protein